MQNARPINRESMRSKRRWEILRRKNILTTARFSHFQKTTEVCPVFLMPKWFVFFACPDAVYNKIMDRLGSELADYQLNNNSLKFVPIRLCEPAGDGAPRALKALKPKTTTTTSNRYKSRLVRRQICRKQARTKKRFVRRSAEVNA